MKLSDASWIAPLLIAVANGETLQHNHPYFGWCDVVTNLLDFDDLQQNYRIKPKVHEYRLYQHTCGFSAIYCTERNSGRPALEKHRLLIEREALEGAVKWVGDWTPVPN